MCRRDEVFVTKINKMGSEDRRRRKRKLMERDEGKCFWCKTMLAYEDATMDHVIPMARGGTDALTNLVLSCQPCNNSRGCRDGRKMMSRTALAALVQMR